jgi:acetoacetyl-CoA reductase
MSKIALVSGGTRGIGAATCIALKEAGYTVIANYADKTEIAALFTQKTGIPAYKWDVSDYEACAAGISKIQHEVGNIDILVNNAGITRDCMFHKMTPKMWTEVVNTNLNGLFNMTHQVWSHMRDQKFGRIINISSINAQKGQIGQVNYSAAKAGDIGFTKALAQEGAKFNITVNAVCPGYIATKMVKMIDEKFLNEQIISKIPIGRLGTPDEIARCVVFLASDDSGFMTGTTLSVNGGQHMD